MKKLSDKELYAECKKWGTATLHARRQFERLLPEVNKRKLYTSKGFETIYDFARILAGMSTNQVNRIFCVNKRLSDKPMLQKLFIEGKVGVNKLARITSIATSENQEELAKKVQTLSNRAIETYVKENKRNAQYGNQNGLFKTSKDVHVHVEDPASAIVHKNNDFEIINALSPELKKKIKELIEKGHDINKILLELLNKREQEIENEIEKISQEVQTKESNKATTGITTTRYKPRKTIQILTKKFGTKCSKPGCKQPTNNIHHEKPFSEYHTHDPKHLKPLCKSHHELAHEKDIQFQKFRQLAINR